jgi:hypothetical protein
MPCSARDVTWLTSGSQESPLDTPIDAPSTAEDGVFSYSLSGDALHRRCAATEPRPASTSMIRQVIEAP